MESAKKPKSVEVIEKELRRREIVDIGLKVAFFVLSFLVVAGLWMMTIAGHHFADDSGYGGDEWAFITPIVTLIWFWYYICMLLIPPKRGG